MRYEENAERSKSRKSFRTIMDLGMGIFYVGIGGMLVFLKRFGLMEIPPWIAYSLGTIMVVGGALRFYKGLTAVLPKKEERNS